VKKGSSVGLRQIRNVSESVPKATSLAKGGEEQPISCHLIRRCAGVGIPVKVNGDSSGKPNGVPVKANSRRSEAEELRRGFAFCATVAVNCR
jgi:hypothetical protein